MNIVDLDIPGLARSLQLQVHDDARDRMISATLRRDRIWEPYETALTLQHLKEGDVYVDVGANIGYYTLIAAARVGAKGKVFAYEPDPDNFALLKTNVERNGLSNVQVFPLALGDRHGEGKLFLSNDNFGDHRLYGTEATRASRTVALAHGGEHLAALTSRIDFLKVDTQGAEFFVMNGLRDLLYANRDHVRLIIECCPWGIRHSGADGHALIDLLDELDLRLDIIDHQQSCLIPAQMHHLRDWVSAMAQEPNNEGFVNLLLTP